MTPRIGKGIVVGLFLLVAQSLEAQQSPPTLDTVLSDAAYVFNRYEELTTGIDCDTWKVPESMKNTCKDELKAIGSNVKSVKPALGRAAKAKNANLVDLFDVYAELQDCRKCTGWIGTMWT